jgi:hypothetical protein
VSIFAGVEVQNRTACEIIPDAGIQYLLTQCTISGTCLFAAVLDRQHGMMQHITDKDFTMKLFISRLTARLVSSVLFIVKNFQMIEDYFVDIETHGLLDRLRIEQDGSQFGYRIEFPVDYWCLSL